MNSQPPSGFHHVTRDKSRVMQTRPALRAYWPSISYIVIVATANVTIPNWLEIGIGPKYAGLGLVQWLTILSAAITLGRLLLKRYWYLYEVTNDSVIVWRGPPGLKVIDFDVPLKGLIFRTRQTLIGHLLGFGHVVMQVGDNELGDVLTNIAQPAKVTRWLKHVRNNGLGDVDVNAVAGLATGRQAVVERAKTEKTEKVSRVNPITQSMLPPARYSFTVVQPDSCENTWEDLIEALGFGSTASCIPGVLGFNDLPDRVIQGAVLDATTFSGGTCQFHIDTWSEEEWATTFSIVGGDRSYDFQVENGSDGRTRIVGCVKKGWLASLFGLFCVIHVWTLLPRLQEALQHARRKRRERMAVMIVSASEDDSTKLLKLLTTEVTLEDSVGREAAEVEVDRFHSLSLVAEWNGSHEAPRSTPRIILPTRISWNPDGSRLVTAGGPYGASVWNSAGNLEGSHRPIRCFGPVREIVWSPDGSRFMKKGGSGWKKMLELYDAQGNRLGGLHVGIRGPWSNDMYNGYNPLEPVPRVSPWRPNSRTVLFGNCSYLSLVHEESFWSDTKEIKLATADVPTEVYRTVNDLSSHDSATKDAYIENYVWRPCGDFLALTLRSRSTGTATEHIVHFETARIVATIPRAQGVSWSPNGLELLVRTEKTHPDETVLNAPYAAIWQSKDATLRHIGPHDSPSWYSKVAWSTEKNGLANATGQFIAKVCENTADDWTPKICDRLTDREIGALPQGLAHVAWSPTDPLTLATVGGQDAPESVRIWRIED